MKRQSYSREFKRQAVDLILIEGHPICFIALTFNIHENTLYRQVAEYEEIGQQTFPGKGRSDLFLKIKLKYLKKENRLL